MQRHQGNQSQSVALMGSSPADYFNGLPQSSEAALFGGGQP